MSNQTRKNQSPDEKKNRPLGKSLSSIIDDVYSFAVQLNDGASHPSLTSVSSSNKTSLLPSKEPNDELVLRTAQDKLATGDDSSNAVWQIKIFLN